MARYIDADELYRATQKRISEAHEARMAIVDDEFLELIDDAFTEDVVPRTTWICTEDRLPNDLEWVQVYAGNRRYRILQFEKGIDEDTREKMRTGEIPDPETTGWTQIDGFFMIKRSKQFKAADVFGNNMVPHCWRTEYGDTIFGQNITWWRHLPEPPEGE